MILIVDDDAAIIRSLTLLLKQSGYQTRSAGSPAEALDLIAQEQFDLVLQDMNFSRETSGQEGLQLLARIKEMSPRTPVLLITAWGSIGLAVQGIKAGATDFITKPWNNQQMLQLIQTALDISSAEAEGKEGNPTRKDLESRYDLTGLIGSDPAFVKIIGMVGRIAPTDASVLITGETGTGKEMIAEAIHRNSRRKDAPFVKVNLGGISSSIFESEMFGHTKGAFTDARQDRLGRFALADTGTIFLDEIGDLDFTCQVKLLRVLQDRTYEMLGSSQSRRVDVRVISATHQNVFELVEQGKMREDLLYRLNLISLHLPPLRERPGDFAPLIEFFLSKLKNAYERPSVTIAPAAIQWLRNQPWPGNIRQLRQVIERSVLLSNKDTLVRSDIELAAQMRTVEFAKELPPHSTNMTLEAMEKAMIVRCVEQYKGNLTRTAEALGVSRAALYRRLEKYGIEA